MSHIIMLCNWFIISGITLVTNVALFNRPYYFLLVVSTKYDSLLQLFLDITTFTVNASDCNHEQSFSLDTIIIIIIIIIIIVMIFCT